MKRVVLAVILAASASASVLAACGDNSGIRLNRSLAGSISPSDDVPEGTGYLLRGRKEAGWGSVLTTDYVGKADVFYQGDLAKLEFRRDGNGFSASGKLGIASIGGMTDSMLRDRKYLFDVPGSYGRYVLQLPMRTNDKTTFLAFFAERRCESGYCVLGMNDGTMPSFADFKAAGVSLSSPGLKCAGFSGATAEQVAAVDAGLPIPPRPKDENTPPSRTPERAPKLLDAEQDQVRRQILASSNLDKCSGESSSFASLLPEMEKSGLLDKLDYQAMLLIYTPAGR